MAIVDYVILSVVGISTLISLVRGFVKESLSLLTWIAAFAIAMGFSQATSVWVPKAVDIPSARVALAFMVLFVLVLIIGGVINWIVSTLVNKTGLTGTDRSVGMVFGLIRGVFIVAILILLAHLTAMPQEPWWQASTLIPQFQIVANWIQALLPADLAHHFVQQIQQVQQVQPPSPTAVLPAAPPVAPAPAPVAPH
ncbi:CvpA family protein [Halothiobacillus sp. DCM-1]|uniref:CvpA family protein n=1 Tax=Halothiobacillus sp. DCM-1 TaxID=3112558 RepID=UPI0032505700